jgi:two-component system LytT family sensor kinase
MKKLTLEIFIDQRKPLSHILYILVAIVALIVVLLWKGSILPASRILMFLLLGLIQLEVFIFVARQVFKKVNTNLTGKELTKMVLTRFFLFLTICFIAAVVIILLFEYSITILKRGDLSMVLSNFMQYEFKSWFRGTIGGLSFGALLFIIIQWQDALKREQKLREENLVFQNETLKSQVNPHFLFNSLNTVSSLIQSEPEKAEQFINNLSSVYRYILENGQKDKVPVQSELDLLNRYFDLHRVRDEEKIALSIDYSGADNYHILPVSLQILLENAIKHNTATRENPLNISVYFEDQYIVVKNNLQKKATQLKSTGIGLRNLAERIRLVMGEALIIEENDKFFIAKIPLQK